MLSKLFSAKKKRGWGFFLLFFGGGGKGCLMNFLSDQICSTNVSHHVLNLMKTKSTINLYIILQFRFAKGHELCTAKKLHCKGNYHHRYFTISWSIFFFLIFLLLQVIRKYETVKRNVVRAASTFCSLAL